MGQATTSTSPSPSPSQSPTATSSPTEEPWLTYSDTRSGFTVEYPPDFETEVIPRRPSFRDELGIVRFYDMRFAGRYPDGQVSLILYQQDENHDPPDWVRAHSAPKSAPDDERVYFRDMTNLRNGTAANRQSASFEWFADEAGTVHAVAFNHRTYVIVIEWFGNPDYQATLEPIYDRLLSSWREA